MKIAKRLISAILAVSSVMSLPACAAGDKGWVSEYKGEKLPAGVYINELMNSYYEASSKITDQSKKVLKQKIEDKDAAVWITEKATNKIKEYYAINDKFDELGLKLSASDQKAIKASVDKEFASYKDYYEKNGIGLSSVVLVNTNAKKSEMIFDKYYGKGGINEVAEKDIKASIDSENVKVVAMPFTIKAANGTDKISDEELAKVKEKANSYLTRAQAGEKMSDLIYEGEKATSAKPDEVKKQADDYYETVVSKSNTTPAIQKLFEATAAKKSGDIFTVETDDYIFVVKKLDMAQTDYTARMESALYTLKSDEYQAMVTKWAEGIKVNFNDKATKYYTPSKLKVQ